MDKVTERDKELGGILAAARTTKGLTQTEAGVAAGRNQAWMSRVESGRQSLKPTELDLLLALYQPADELGRIIEQLRTPAPAGARPGSRLDPKFMELKKLEQTASEIRVLTSERIPMSLQSQQYLLLQYHRAGYAVNEADLLAEHRRRQQVFTRDNPAPYHVLMSESALYQMPAGRLELVREQATYLLNLIESHPQVRLQVLRFGSDLPYLEADMVILRFETKPPYKVFVPHGTSVSTLKGSDLRSRVNYWQEAQRAALSVDDSRKFLHKLAEMGYQPPL